MKTMQLLCGLVAIIMLVGCAGTNSKMSASAFQFAYQDKIYEIESVNSGHEAGYNLLIQRDGQLLLFKAIDQEQDGSVDKIITGDISLADANTIYHAGIQDCKKKGGVKIKTENRVYKTSDPIHTYILKTYILATGESYNKLFIVSNQAFIDDIVIMDLDADGTLNQTNYKFENLAEYQKLYDIVLNRGLQSGKVVKTNSHYFVSYNPM